MRFNKWCHVAITSCHVTRLLAWKWCHKKVTSLFQINKKIIYFAPKFYVSAWLSDFFRFVWKSRTSLTVTHIHHNSNSMHLTYLNVHVYCIRLWVYLLQGVHPSLKNINYSGLQSELGLWNHIPNHTRWCEDFIIRVSCPPSQPPRQPSELTRIISRDKSPRRLPTSHLQSFHMLLSCAIVQRMQLFRNRWFCTMIKAQTFLYTRRAPFVRAAYTDSLKVFAIVKCKHGKESLLPIFQPGGHVKDPLT